MSGSTEAILSGSGVLPESPFYEAPLNSPPEIDSTSTTPHIIPAVVIIVSIAALLIMAGGFKVGGLIRQRRKRHSYKAPSHVHMESNAVPLMKPCHPFNTGHKDYPQGWSTLPLVGQDTAVRQPSLREAVRIADALDEVHHEEVGAEMMTEITSLDSSTYGDITSAQTTVVEVELH